MRSFLTVGTDLLIFTAGVALLTGITFYIVEVYEELIMGILA